MEVKLKEIILRICQTLNNNNVQYLIVGGSAVALHGFFRMSISRSGFPAEKFDLDIWYNPSYPNYFNLLNALESLGEDVSEFRNEQTPKPEKSFFKFDFEQFTLDFLPSIGDLQKFRDSHNSCDLLSIDGIEVPFINMEDLILNKERQGRPADIEDVIQLKKIKKSDNTSNKNIR